MQDNNLENKERRNSQVTTAVISAILLIVGGFFLSYNYIQSKKIVAYDYMSNVFYNGEECLGGGTIDEVFMDGVKRRY